MLNDIVINIIVSLIRLLHSQFMCFTVFFFVEMFNISFFQCDVSTTHHPRIRPFLSEYHIVSDGRAEVMCPFALYYVIFVILSATAST